MKALAAAYDAGLPAHAHDAQNAHDARQPGILNRSVPADAHDARWLQALLRADAHDAGQPGDLEQVSPC